MFSRWVIMFRIFLFLSSFFSSIILLSFCFSFVPPFLCSPLARLSVLPASFTSPFCSFLLSSLISSLSLFSSFLSLFSSFRSLVFSSLPFLIFLYLFLFILFSLYSSFPFLSSFTSACPSFCPHLFLPPFFPLFFLSSNFKKSI